ncbi:hypothetical protein V1634_26915 [Plantactinospora veratri]|uniref:Uncharacterized protein n=1 Tax=Plantactinospora veratri TaxID=1436122 RepID=A0ABU7SKK7_9ACTN
MARPVQRGPESARHARIESVREALADAGIESFDAMVEKLASATPRLLQDSPVPLMRADDGESLPPPPPPPQPHRPPHMMVMIDGELNEPQAVREFDGRPLYSTPGVDVRKNPVLYSFTSMEGLHRHLGTLGWDDIGTTNPDSLPEYSVYSEHDSQGGDSLTNRPGYGWRDLSRVPRGFLGTGDWNDIISSVNWCRWDISLWEHAGWTGSTLYLRAGRTYYHLSEYGWNDRASSTVNWGRRYYL